MLPLRLLELRIRTRMQSRNVHCNHIQKLLKLHRTEKLLQTHFEMKYDAQHAQNRIALSSDRRAEQIWNAGMLTELQPESKPVPTARSGDRPAEQLWSAGLNIRLQST